MWNAEPFIEILAGLAPAAVRESEPEALREYLANITLAENCRRPVRMTEAGARLREYRGGFVYDRQAGFLIACAFGEHSQVAAALAQVRSLAAPFEPFQARMALTSEREKFAERFLNEGWGFVVNSPSLSGSNLERPWPLRLGPEVSLTAQEKLWFRGFELIRRE